MKKFLLTIGLLTTTLLQAPQASAQPQAQTAQRDSLTKKEKMALELIQSVNQLSQTASKLSQTALELIGKEQEGKNEKTEAALSSAVRRQSKTPRTTRTEVPEIIVPGFTEEDARTQEELFSPVNTGESARDALIRKWSSGKESIPAEDLFWEETGTEEDYYEEGNGDTTNSPEEEEIADGQDFSTEDEAGGFPFLSPDSREESGSYLWVPDSLIGRVQALIENPDAIPTSTGRPSGPEIPSDTKVLFRGDTLDMVLRDRNFGRYDRRLFNYLAVPKGIWKASLTASYGEITTQDMEVMDLISNVNLGGYLFSIKPAISYFIRNNLALGVRLSYTRGHGYVDGFNVDIDEDMNFALNDIDYTSESYRAGFTVTRYLGLSPRSRFHLSNEIELAFASGNSDFTRPFGGELKTTHTTTMSVGVTYSPGVSVQIMRNVSFDLSFGVFGFNLKSERQSVDGVDLGRRTTSGANFRFNIFNLSFGIGVNL